MSVLIALAAPAAEQICTTPAECANLGVDNFVGTPARIWASVAALVALIGVVFGGLARPAPAVVSATAGEEGPSWPWWRG